MSFINGFTTLSYKEFGDNGYFVTLKKLLPEKFLGLVNIKHNNFNNSQQCEALTINLVGVFSFLNYHFTDSFIDSKVLLQCQFN